MANHLRSHAAASAQDGGDKDKSDKAADFHFDSLKDFCPFSIIVVLHPEYAVHCFSKEMYKNVPYVENM